MLRDSRVNLVRVATTNLVSNPDSDIRLQLEWGHYWCFGFAHVSWVLINIFIESWDCCQNNAREMQDPDFVELSVHNFFVERLWYTCPYYNFFFKSSGLWLLLLPPTLSLVRVLPLDSRLSSVQVAAADLVLNPDSDIGLGEGCLTSPRVYIDLISWIS
jgi:hypothetical protein